MQSDVRPLYKMSHQNQLVLVNLLLQLDNRHSVLCKNRTYNADVLGPDLRSLAMFLSSMVGPAAAGGL